VRIRLHSTIVTALAAVVALGAHAAERATLSNGFLMQCDHHVLVDGKLRLYVSTGENSYIELKPEEVTGFEKVADALSQSPVPVSQGSAANGQLNPADLHEMLDKAGHEHNLDVDLLASLVKAESGGNAHAVSRTGAKGLMQLMPGTANDLGVQDSFKPSENVRGGTTYLDTLLRKYHENLALALAAYNAGPAAVDKYHGIPPYHETRAYVARVIHEFNRRVLAREAEARRASAAVPITSRDPSAQ
jgi:soluble lytic murein transglycosylase-like protein